MSKGLLLSAVVCAALLSGSPAFAQDEAPKKEPSAKQLAQRAKMKSCSAEAKSQGLKGDDRKGFMKTCLSGGGAEAPAVDDQKEKTKACSAEAKEKALKGDERKAFMKTCLAG